MRTSSTAIAIALGAACGKGGSKPAPPAPAAPPPTIDAHARVAIDAIPPDAGLAPLTKLAPQPVLGPYHDVAAYCDEQPGENRRGDLLSCDRGKPGLTGPTAIASPAPYLDVHLFPVDNGIDCSLVITTAGGVFVADRIVGCDWPGKDGAAITELAVHGGAIVVRSQRRSTFSIGGVTTAEIEDDAVVCGVGPSKKPSCTPNIPLSLERRPKSGAPRRAAITLTVADDGASIDLEGDAKSLVLDAGDEFRAEGAADTGRHALAFP